MTIEKQKERIAFLQRWLNCKYYKRNASPEERENTKKRLEREKDILQKLN